MSKLRLSFIMILFACLITTAFGQMFGSSSTTKKPAASGRPAPPLSADDFAKQVNTKAQQAQAQMLQQSQGFAKQQLNQVPAQDAPPISTKNITRPTDKSNKEKEKTDSEPDQTSMPEPATSARPMQSTPEQAPSPAAANTPTMVQPETPTAPQGQGQVYTGFQGSGGNSNTGGSNNAAPAGGGWNVKY